MSVTGNKPSDDESSDEESSRDILGYVPTMTQFMFSKVAEGTMEFFAESQTFLQIKENTESDKYPELMGKKVILSSGDYHIVYVDDKKHVPFYRDNPDILYREGKVPIILYHCYSINDTSNVFAVRLEHLELYKH